MVTKTDAEFRCEFCEKVFQKENSLAVHVCEQKRRWQDREEPAVRLAFNAYLRFYERNQGSARLKTYDDFARSAYYRAFVKWARYCISIKAINPARFLDWLLDHNHKIDHWSRDSMYTGYLSDYVRRETVEDALSRAMETALYWSESTGNPVKDYLRYGNVNSTCYEITAGRITAWILYNCDSGQKFLDNLNPEQIAMIWIWIDPEYWHKKLRDYPADREYAREILIKAGW